MRCNLLVVGIVLPLIALIGASAAQAQVGLSPAFVDAAVQGGKAYTQTFTLANKSQARMRFRCSVSDYAIDEIRGRILDRPGSLPRSASLWVQFSPAEIIVEPQSSAPVNVVITVPPDAAGGYYTVPFFEGEPVQEPADNKAAHAASAGVVVRLGAFIMFATTDAEYNVDVIGSHVEPPTQSSELEMQTDIRNHSTAHVRLRGLFAIVDAAGKIAGSGRIEDKWYLPGQHEAIKSSWAGMLLPGHYTVVSTLTYDRTGKAPATVINETPLDVK